MLSKRGAMRIRLAEANDGANCEISSFLLKITLTLQPFCLSLCVVIVVLYIGGWWGPFIHGKEHWIDLHFQVLVRWWKANGTKTEEQIFAEVTPVRRFNYCFMHSTFVMTNDANKS